MARFKTIVVNLGILVLALTVVAIVLETGLALVKINSKDYTRFVPEKGATFVPNAYYRYTKEGFSEGYFNSHGFRDYERTYEKPPNTFRILVLGDSYVEAMHVNLADTFTATLEKLLNEHSSSKRFEVLALGQSGAGTADEYMKYLNFGVEYSPDLVLVAFLTGNDFRNNSKYLNRESAGFYFSFDEKHNLALDRSLFDEYQRSLTLPKRLFQTLKRYSYLASLISERLYLLRIQLHENHFMLSSLKSAEAVGGRALNEFSDLNIYCTPLTTRWQEAVDITKGIILKFRASVEERGAKFALVSLSNAEQVHRDVGQRLEAQYGLSFDYDQPDNIMEDFAGQNGITYLKLMPLFRDYHVKTGKYLHGFGSGHGGHWNEYGHRLAAEEIFKFLMGNRLVPIGEGT